MDEKTERLRDLFMDVAGGETITERQQESRGSLGTSEQIDEHLQSVIEIMIDRYGIETTLSIDDLVTLVKRFYAGDSDSEISDALEKNVSPGTVTRARINLHLVTEDDKNPSFDFESFRAHVSNSIPIAEIASEFDISETTARRYRQIVEIETERRLVGDRYRDEFSRIIEDRDLSDQLTKEIHESGLEDATEGLETNVSF